MKYAHIKPIIANRIVGTISNPVSTLPMLSASRNACSSPRAIAILPKLSIARRLARSLSARLSELESETISIRIFAQVSGSGSLSQPVLSDSG